ncbi:MAG: PDZ domain-containing protein, partial [Cyclobacteriaceae bacterium]|nr:PDZ domain-containing protein [Cyclobacteriaceae bacterium]
QHEDYHKPGDDFEKLNYQGMLSVADLIERLINQLDASEKLAFTKTKDESQDTPRFKVTLGVVPDYLFDGEGMRIDGVTDGKPASQAGLLKGDVVVQLGELPVNDMMSYMKALSKFESGDTTTVVVDRDGEQIKAPVEFQ